MPGETDGLSRYLDTVIDAVPEQQRGNAAIVAYHALEGLRRQSADVPSDASARTYMWELINQRYSARGIKPSSGKTPEEAVAPLHAGAQDSALGYLYNRAGVGLAQPYYGAKEFLGLADQEDKDTEAALSEYRAEAGTGRYGVTNALGMGADMFGGALPIAAAALGGNVPASIVAGAQMTGSLFPEMKRMGLSDTGARLGAAGAGLAAGAINMLFPGAGPQAARAVIGEKIAQATAPQAVRWFRRPIVEGAINAGLTGLGADTSVIITNMAEGQESPLSAGQVAENLALNTALGAGVTGAMHTAGKYVRRGLDAMLGRERAIEPLQATVVPDEGAHSIEIAPARPEPVISPEAMAAAALESRTPPEVLVETTPAVAPEGEIHGRQGQVEEAGRIPAVEGEPTVVAAEGQAQERAALGGGEGQEGQVAQAPEPAKPAEAPVVHERLKPFTEGGEGHRLAPSKSSKSTIEAAPVEKPHPDTAIFKTEDGGFVVARTSRKQVNEALRGKGSGSVRWIPVDESGSLTSLDKATHTTLEAARAAAEKAHNSTGGTVDVLGPAQRRGALPKGARDAAIDRLIASDLRLAHIKERLTTETTPEALAAARAEAAKILGDKAVRAAAKAEEHTAPPQEMPPEPGAEPMTQDVAEAPTKVTHEEPSARMEAEESKPTAKTPNRMRRVSQELQEIHDLTEAGEMGHADRAREVRAILTRLSESTDIGEKHLIQVLKDEARLRKFVENPAEHVHALRAAIETAAARAENFKPLTVSDEAHATGGSDGLLPGVRANILNAFAKAFGFTATREAGRMQLHGLDIIGYVDPETKVITYSDSGNLVHGVRILTHEIIDGEIAAMSITDRAKVFQALMDTLADSEAKTALKDLGEAIGDQNPARAMVEMVSDAGAKAVLGPGHNSKFLDLLPDAVAAPIRRALASMAAKIKDIVKRLIGLKGFKDKSNTVAKLEAIATDLLTRARLRQMKPEEANAAAGLVRELLDPDLGSVVTAKGDIAVPLAEAASKIPLIGDMAGSALAEAQLALVHTMQTVAAASPEFSHVVAAYDASEVAANRAVVGLSEAKTAFDALPKTRRTALESAMFALRLRQLETAAVGAPMKTHAEILSALKSHGLSDAEVHIADRIYREMHTLLESKLRSMAEVMQVEWKPTKELQADLEALPENSPDRAAIEKVIEWKQMLDNLPAGYVPLIHNERSARTPFAVVVKNKDGDVVWFDYRPTAEGKQLVKDLRADFTESDGYTVSGEYSPVSSRIDTGAPARNERLRAFAASRGLSDEAAAELLQLVQAMDAQRTGDKFLLKAKGIGGHSTDLSAAMSRYGLAMSHDIRRVRFMADSTPWMTAINADKERPGVARFANQWIRDLFTRRASTADSVAAVLQGLTHFRYMMKPISGFTDFATTTVANIHYLGAVLGPRFDTHGFSAAKDVGHIVHGALTDMLGTGVRGVAKIADLVGLRRVSTAANDKASVMSMVSSVAAGLRRRGKTALADALVSAFRETDLGHNRLIRDLVDGLATQGIRRGAERIVGAATFIRRVMDVAGAVQAFIASHEAAAKFTLDDWRRVRENGYGGARNPRDLAVWAARELTGRYGRVNRPSATRSASTGLAYTFTTWMFNQTRLFVKRLHQIASPDSKATATERLVALGMLASMTATYTMAGGVIRGVPGGQAVATMAQGAYNAVTGDQRTFEQILEQKGTLGDFLAHGVSAFLPEGAAKESIESVGRLVTPGGLIMDKVMRPLDLPVISALKDTYTGVANAITAARNGDMMSAAQNAAGAVSTYGASLFQAYSGGTSRGLTTGTGNTLIPKEQVKTVDRVLLALGVTPATLLRAQQLESTKRRIVEQHRPFMQAQARRLADAILDRPDDNELIDGMLQEYMDKVAALGDKLDAAAPGSTEEAVQLARFTGLLGLRDSLRGEIRERILGMTEASAPKTVRPLLTGQGQEDAEAP